MTYQLPTINQMVYFPNRMGNFNKKIQLHSQLLYVLTQYRFIHYTIPYYIYLYMSFLFQNFKHKTHIPFLRASIIQWLVNFKFILFFFIVLFHLKNALIKKPHNSFISSLWRESEKMKECKICNKVCTVCKV